MSDGVIDSVDTIRRVPLIRLSIYFARAHVSRRDNRYRTWATSHFGVYREYANEKWKLTAAWRRRLSAACGGVINYQTRVIYVRRTRVSTRARNSLNIYSSSSMNYAFSFDSSPRIEFARRKNLLCSFSRFLSIYRLPVVSFADETNSSLARDGMPIYYSGARASLNFHFPPTKLARYMYLLPIDIEVEISNTVTSSYAAAHPSATR